MKRDQAGGITEKELSRCCNAMGIVGTGQHGSYLAPIRDDRPDWHGTHDFATGRETLPEAGVFTWVTSSVGSAGARTARAARASRTANLSHFISVDRRAACFASLWSDATPVATDKSCRLTLVVRCSWVESSWVLGLFARPFFSDPPGGIN